MAVNIVTVNVTEEVAPAPIRLQQTGAIVSQGATTLTAGTYSLLTQVSDLTAILTGSVAITSIVWSGSVVTVTTTTPHGVPSGDTVQGTISGVTPTGYNGTFAITSTGTSTFTYPLVSNPGVETALGVFTLADVAELSAQVTTFFANGTTQSVYVLELGVGTTAQGVTALTAYFTAPTLRFYAYLLPKEWDTESTAVTMAHAQNGLTAQIYFYVTTTISTYTAWLGLKSVIATEPNPTLPSNEFSAAALFQAALARNPNASNMMTPLEYQFVFGVTANTALTTANKVTLTAAGVNWIDTGAQGQISNTLVQNGKYMDLNPFSFWYAVDWVNEHETVALAAAIINGSNTPQNPLYYNQAGINTLQKVAQAVINNSISFGLVLAGATVNAVPFATYVAQNPSDYAVGAYNGLSCTFVPARGFDSITIFLTASNIPR
jgi:hypothetical protein